MKYKKRKDRKGRMLKPGESQRKNGTYQFRYTDIYGKRQCLYAKTLDDLREKEAEIEKSLNCGLDYSEGNITLIELVERYFKITGEIEYNTIICHNFVLNLLIKEEFCHRKIRDIKTSEAKAWFIKLHNDGYSRSTLCSIRGVINPAFEMAVEDRINAYNPFSFPMKSLKIKDDSQKAIAMSDEEESKFMEFIKNDKTYSKYYDECVILLETGLRVSELYGLTIKDIDFINGRISVNHQLLKKRNGEYAVTTPKTESGARYVPMSVEACLAFKRILTNRNPPKAEKVVDGYTGFIFLDKNKNPKVALHLQHAMKRALDKYNNTHKVQLPKITPHVFRHTFCTKMALNGMNIKSLQYIMGHSRIETTLNYYVHTDLEKATKAMGEIVKLVQKAV